MPLNHYENWDKNDLVYLEPRHEVKHAWSSYEKSEVLLGYE